MKKHSTPGRFQRPGGFDSGISLLFLFTVSTLMFPRTVFSAELGLEDIRRAALMASSDMRKLEIEKQNQVLEKMAHYFTYIPSLSASASASYSPFRAAQNSALDGLSAGAQFSINGKISIFDRGKSKNERANLALADSELDAQTQARLFAILEQADSHYFNCLEAEAAIKTAELQAEISAVALETAEIRRAGGILSPSDYFLALSNKSAADSSLAAARTSHSLALRRLEQLIGSSGTVELLPLDFGNYEELLNTISGWTMEEISDRFLKLKEELASRSPSLKSAYITLKRAENTYNLTKSAFLPSLDLSASFSLDYSFIDKPPTDPLSYGASVTLSGAIPLDYWNLINNEQRQRNSLETSRIAYEDTLAAFDIDLQSLLFTLAGNAQTLIANRRQAEYSALLLEQQQELFRLSSASMTTFLDAASRSLSSETQKTRAEFSFLRSLSALKSLGAFEDRELLGLLVE
ncbi:MAG: TolC family protein [Treponema sp.]|jgi:outer membrane protein TolC|nr:TolC family protein [Treponema sp.]